MDFFIKKVYGLECEVHIRAEIRLHGEGIRAFHIKDNHYENYRIGAGEAILKVG